MGALIYRGLDKQGNSMVATFRNIKAYMTVPSPPRTYDWGLLIKERCDRPRHATKHLRSRIHLGNDSMLLNNRPPTECPPQGFHLAPASQYDFHSLHSCLLITPDKKLLSYSHLSWEEIFQGTLGIRQGAFGEHSAPRVNSSSTPWTSARSI